MKFSIRIACLAGAFALSSYNALAEDIDLFLGVPTAATAELPNVLIILDNTSNWSTAFVNEQKALADTFANLPVDKFNVGIMTFGVPDVGLVRAAIRTMDATNRAAYQNLIDEMVDATQQQGGDRASARTLARTMSEAYRYLKGMQSVETRTSLNNDHRDYALNPFGSPNNQAVHALAGNALSSATDNTYTSPLPANSCADTFIIYIGNTVPGGNVTKDNSSRNTAAGTELYNAGGAAAVAEINDLAYDSHQGNWADEWARFLYNDMGIRVYTVDVDPTPYPPETGGQINGLGNSDLLESMARNSDGKYFRVSSGNGGDDIKVILGDIFSEIQAENSVFASVALPASSTTQSTFLNQVFIGMFRPDAGRKPRWDGNLKQYRLGKVGSAGNEELKLLDARETEVDGVTTYYEAINSKTGFITECARSYWTPTTPDTYWNFLTTPRGECLGADATSNTPDGPVVEKGGQGYIRRASTKRTVYTCNGTVACAAAGILTVFGKADIDNGNALINWVVGQDVDDENGDTILTTMRPSTHGDVIHARPVALNYGDDDDPKVAVFYGANDGLLRSVNGNRSVGFDSVAAGGEFWAFKPPEFGNTDLTRLRDNTPTIQFPATGTSRGASGIHKDYGMDGAVVAFDGDIGGFPKKFIFASMRRGGRAVYGFDVTSVNLPSLLWRVGCEESLASTVCTDPDWANIGQTWSRPSVAFREGYDDGVAAPDTSLLPILLMGGGYDTCEDQDYGPAFANHACGASTKGNSIYVVDAQSGTVLKEFATLRAVPGAVTVVPVSKDDPTIKFAYAADTGGNVYRISGPEVVDEDTGTGTGVMSPIGDNLWDDWEITRIASLGCPTDSTCTANRKFLFEPDVVEPRNGNGALYVLLGSGDREKPLLFYGATASVSNYAFALVDKPSDGTWLSAESATCSSPLICMDSLTPVTTATGVGTGVTPSTKGWKLALDPTEQVISSALTVSDTMFFSTHIPTPPAPAGGSCDSDLGVATTYQLSYKDGEGNEVPITGGGLVPSPVAGKVILDDGEIVPFCIACGGEKSAIGSQEITSSVEWEQPTGRVYWRIEK